jgi:hypothetical protein
MGDPRQFVLYVSVFLIVAMLIVWLSTSSFGATLPKVAS